MVAAVTAIRVYVTREPIPVLGSATPDLRVSSMTFWRVHRLRKCPHTRSELRSAAEGRRVARRPRRKVAVLRRLASAVTHHERPNGEQTERGGKSKLIGSEVQHRRRELRRSEPDQHAYGRHAADKESQDQQQ
jgi:hypothetical protein